MAVPVRVFIIEEMARLMCNHPETINCNFVNLYAEGRCDNTDKTTGLFALGVGLPGGAFALCPFQPNLPGIAANWKTRASQEAAVPAHPDLQPVVAFRAGLDGLATVAALEFLTALDQQPFPAYRARPLTVLTVRIVRAAVENTSILPVLTSYEPSLDAYRAGNITFLRLAKDRDVVTASSQFRCKRRRRTTLGEQEGMASGAGDGNIKQAPLFSVRMRFRRSKHQVEQRVVCNFSGKAVFSGTQSEHHDIVRFQPLGPVHGLVRELEAGILPRQARHVCWLQMVVPSQQQYGRDFFVSGSILSNPVERLFQQ